MGIRGFIRKRKLQKALEENSRLKVIKNLGRMRSVLVVCSVKTPDGLLKYKQYFRNLDQNFSRIDVLFYMPMAIAKEKRDDLDKHILYPHQLNWLGRPIEAKRMKEFREFPYDLLIDLNFDSIFALQWISVKSQAALKVGPMIKNEDYYDMVIDTKNPMEQSKLYIDQIFHFLRQINNNGHQ
ncbi:MAG: hypothetical protein B7C24_01290 [Bacteroidetes bacterium 4572_77]|nr:MAG: hypothetical protein B7C24_01290 [Bacteroidetes bacterium 4572_77]